MKPEVHPDHWSNGPRLGARGVVRAEDRILLLRYERDGETLYIYPGGGHEIGETLVETAEREVYEETGISATAGRIVAVHEIQPSKGLEFPDDIRSIYVTDAHRVDIYFEFEVASVIEPTLEVAPDLLHVGFTWATLDELDDLPVMPDISAQLRDSLGQAGHLLRSDT